jgi:hypothetical protein
MNLALTWANCFWLLLPILAWNIIFGAKITQEQITSDAHSPAWLLGAENIFRLAAFILPLFLPLPRGADWQSALPKISLAVYVIGVLVYFASWLPLMIAPQSAWSQSIPGLFAPRLTPLIWLAGVALVANSWPYGLLATIFIFFHTWHGAQNL